ncbi:type III PLP-dependent enzyme [Paracoccus aminophilus]|uniref:ornithine decarboxylase n=1 Tax=Paracoccus aminophilus JCM 7686 TaxID=1367847 RepID=S5XRC0_PARAH|nr:type III PLP-dependent enzyme [Paracoccus aminophilus]AGT07607.1 ornithine decarboxylase [Paracoccus aminophilus JCM 7686]
MTKPASEMQKTIWDNPSDIIRSRAPDHPVMAFSPLALEATARRFLDGFPGQVTYAVKSNPDPSIIRVLYKTGVTGFDVASPAEIDLIGQIAPAAARHYHNPVRASAEIAHAAKAGIRAWSVDSQSELAKIIARVPPDGVEISPRFKLPVSGAIYDFGSKFGAPPELAVTLLQEVAARGFTPSLTFHPGTQCTDPAAWESYIRTAGDIATQAGITPARLNVGGGFPSHRVTGAAPDLEAIFALIARVTRETFGASAPALVCEPGRGLCADAFSLITRVKALRDGQTIFLNDGVYGGLSELPIVGNLDRIEVLDPKGQPRRGEPLSRTIFGPTCDSVDRLPGELDLPEDLKDGDYVIFHGAGAYSTATNTRFNGFGEMEHLTVRALG